MKNEQEFIIWEGVVDEISNGEVWSYLKSQNEDDVFVFNQSDFNKNDFDKLKVGSYIRVKEEIDSGNFSSPEYIEPYVFTEEDLREIESKSKETKLLFDSLFTYPYKRGENNSIIIEDPGGDFHGVEFSITEAKIDGLDLSIDFQIIKGDQSLLDNNNFKLVFSNIINDILRNGISSTVKKKGD